MIDRAYASTRCGMNHVQGQLWVWAMVDVFWSSCALDWTKSICSKLQDSIGCYAYVGSTSFLLIGCLSFTTKNCQVPGLSFIVKAFLWFSVCTHVSFNITRFGKWTTDCSKTKLITLLYYNNNFNFLIRKMIEDYRLNIS